MQRIEGIYFIETGVLISSRVSSDEVINCDLYLEPSQDQEMLTFLNEEYNKTMCFAQKEFLKAYETHRSLEEIYTPAMNFDAVSEIRENLTRKIKLTLY